jgi:hypothetical protein
MEVIGFTINEDPHHVTAECQSCGDKAIFVAGKVTAEILAGFLAGHRMGCAIKSCRWCEVETGVKVDGFNVTHGICARHCDQFVAEIKEHYEATSLPA